MPPPSERRFRRHPRALGVGLAGVVALVAAGGFGTPALRPLGIGLLALGVGSILLVEIVARGLTVARSVDGDVVRAGEDVAAAVRVTGWPVSGGALRLMDWEIRPGIPAGASVAARRPTWVRGEVRQELRFGGLPRGEHRLGPPGIALTDPFGLARARRASRASSSLLVCARTVPVVVPFWESGSARRIGESPGVLRGRSELGGVRDYEPGDPMSLIHWAQSARRGRLQTKELHGESGRGAALQVVLDARADPAQGTGPAAAFEEAVSAAASLVAACARRGDPVGFAHTGATPVSLPVGVAPGRIERELATVAADGAQPIGLAVRAAASQPDAPRMIVVVTCCADRGLVTSAGQARSAGTSLAVVLLGAACAYAPELRRAGAWVSEVPPGADLAAALDGSGSDARRA